MINKALHRILGKEWDKSGTKRKAAHGFVALSAQRDEMRDEMREEEAVQSNPKKSRKLSKAKDVDDVIAAQYAVKGGADSKPRTNTSLVTRVAEMEHTMASNRFVYASRASTQGRGRLTFPEDCPNGAVRVQWPSCGRLTLTLGKRGNDDFREINVPPGTSVGLTYCKDADSDDDSE